MIRFSGPVIAVFFTLLAMLFGVVLLIWISFPPHAVVTDKEGAAIPPYPHESKAPIYAEPRFQLDANGAVRCSKDITAIDCTGAPQQYVNAGSWIDAGHRFKCDPQGEKHYLFYSDAQIP